MQEMKANLSEKDRKNRDMILNDSMWKVVLRIGTPLALYQLLTVLFSIFDTMMAGHISSVSVSAVAYLSQINNILSAVGGGLAIGAGIEISKAYGQGEYLLVKKQVSSLYAMVLTAGLVILGAILPFTESFLRFCRTPEELISAGAAYFRVQLLVMVVTILNDVYISVQRARGNSRHIMNLNLLAIAVKLSLTAIFVYLLNGTLVQVAEASLISQALLLVIAIVNSRDGDSVFGFSLHAVRLDREVNLPMIIRSLPVTAEKALFAFGKSIVNTMCTAYGALMVGAMGVSNNLGGITTNPQNGYKDGSAAIISQNYGAGKFDRILSAFYVTAVYDMILGAVISGIELLNLYALSSLFSNGDLAFTELIANVYRYEALGAIPLGLNAAVLGLLYGIGETRLGMILNLLRVFVFRIPVFKLLQRFTAFGDKIPGLVMFISNTLTGIASIFFAVYVIRKLKRSHKEERELINS